jgi:hypothetical protein
MKKITSFILLLVSLFIYTSCNNSGVETKAKVDVKAGNVKSCCFMDNEEAQQFFPVATSDIKPAQASPTGNLVCTEDVGPENGLTQTYTTGKGRLVLKINDYCINPRKLELDYDRRYKTTLKIYGADRELKELSGPNGSYKGFAVYSATNKMSYLAVIVDGRFGITVVGVDQENFTDINRLFEMIPVEKLAAFKK